MKMPIISYQYLENKKYSAVYNIFTFRATVLPHTPN